MNDIMKNKLILIGFDGAALDITKQWIEEGELPSLKKMIETGVHSRLESVMPYGSCIAGTSFYTGKNPAKTTVFNYIRDDGSFLDFNQVRGPTFWSILEKYGYRCCVLDVPITYPPEKISGAIIASPAPEGSEDFTYPKSLIEDDEVRNFNVHVSRILKLCENPKINKEKILMEFKRDIDLKFRVLTKNLRSEKYDLSILWVAITDLLQHFFWEDKEAMLSIYSHLDGKIGELLKEFSKSDIIIFSDHGFAKSEDYYFHVNEWLKMNGYLKLNWNRLKMYLFYKGYYLIDRYLPKKWRNMLVKPIIKSIKKTTPKELSKPLHETRIIKLDSTWKRLKGIDWSKTMAFMDQLWGIRINQDKLERKYEEARDDIVDKLRQLEYKKEKVMERVWVREEIFSGGAVEEVPDIIFLAKRKYEPTGIILSSVFTKRRRKEKYKAGIHYPTNGIFIAYGPDFKKGLRLERVSLLDIVPTSLRIFGVPVPKDIDGSILKQIFIKLSPKTKKGVKSNKEIKKSKRSYTKKEEEELKNKLKILGYI